MSNRFQYQSRPAEAWQGRSDQSGGGFIGIFKDGVQTYTVVKKDNSVRVCPPTWPDAKHFGLDVWVHYGVGPQNATVLCELKMASQKCPVCDAYTIAENEGKDDAYDLKAKRRVLIYLVSRTEADKGKPPLAWATPWTFDKDLAILCKDKATGEIYLIDHPDNGYDIYFDRDGEVPNVKYVGMQIARRSSALEDIYLDYIVAHPLPGILLHRTYEEVKSLFEGGSSTIEPPINTQQRPDPIPQTNGTPPWQQPVQTQTAPPVQQTYQERPVQQVSFCPASVSFQGNTLGCASPAGNPKCASGIHDFSRVLTAPAQTNGAPPMGTVTTSMPTPQPQPVQTAAEPSRTDSLRARFGRG